MKYLYAILVVLMLILYGLHPMRSEHWAKACQKWPMIVEAVFD